MTTTTRALLTVDEAAELYAMSRWTLYRWATDGRIPSVKVGRLRRFEPEALASYFRAHRQGTEAAQA